MTGPIRTRRVTTPSLEIAYEERGPERGQPIILLHGFPDDVRAWDGVVTRLASAGHRCIVPYLRGYGPTRFLDPRTPRSGEQAALGADLLALLDGLGIGRAILAGYDWGGRAACIVAALWPERVRGLVSIGGYNIQDIARNGTPDAPEQEQRFWYQWYFNTERGRAGLARNRYALCRRLWQLWSPNWQFDEATYRSTAAAFDNPDFVDVVIHSYRHRYGAAPGDPALAAIEALLARQPMIRVPTIVLHGACDGVDPPAGSENAAAHFTGPYRRAVVPVAGHFLPWEAPEPIADAVLSLAAEASV
ncbi:MAG TPA: alpha/beta hydrolase [Acetobacteraceae bacterium]|nr:alpha/beta hydrolase [Acetobacteraceae bacterium]